MTLQEGLEYCNIVLAKDQNGNTLSPQQYNVLLKAVNDELFEDKYLDFVKNKTLPYALQLNMLNSSPIRKFVTNLAATAVNGVVTMPTDARYPASVIAYVTPTAPIISSTQEKMRNVEMVDEQGFAILKTSVLHRDITENPIGVQRDRSWVFLPSTVQRYDIAYFRNPAVPYYDYAVDPYDNVVFLQSDYILTAIDNDNNFSVAYDNGITTVTLHNTVYYDAQSPLNTVTPTGTVLTPLTT